MQKQAAILIKSNLKLLLNMIEWWHTEHCSVGLDIYMRVSVALLTRVLPSLIPLDEADNEEDQDE